MSIEAYKIAVTLALRNEVSSGLLAVSRDFRRVEEDAKAVHNQIKAIQAQAKLGFLMTGASLAMVASLKAPIEEAAKFDQAVAKFKLFGLGDAMNEEAVKFARGMNVMGSSYTENMKMMTEAQGVFRESGLEGAEALEGSKLAAPMLAKIKFATESLDDESKERMHTQSLAMLRFVEMRGGLKDADTFNRIADSGWKAIQSSGGNVNWEQMRQFMARAGVAGQGLSDTSLFAKLEPVIGELKGSTAGNAWMTSYNRLVGGVKVPNQVAHLLAESGIWDKNKIEWNSQGGIKQFRGNPLNDMATFSSDPVEFYKKHMLPMYAAMNGGKGLSAEERGRENTMIFGRTGGAMFSLIDRQMAAIERSVAAQAKALSVQQSVDTAKETPIGKFKDLKAKFDNLLIETGTVILPIVNRALEKLNPILKDFADWMHENPRTVGVLADAFITLGAALAFGGAVNLMAAGFRGLSMALQFASLGGPAGIWRLVAGLTGSGEALGLLAKASFVATAAFAGWELGKWLYDSYIAGTKFSDWLGGLIARIMSWMGSENAKEAIAANENPAERKKLAEIAAEQKRIAEKYYHGFDKAAAEAAAESRASKKYAGMPPTAISKQATPQDQNGQLPSVMHKIEVHNYIDGKDVASHMVPNYSSGTTGFNLGASIMRPGMGNFGVTN